jgi:predicted DNA-binding transcriptional regulator AlpA
MAFLTIKEAAAFLKVSTSWLYQNKDVPRYRIPGLRFEEAELAAWVKSRQASWRDGDDDRQGGSQELEQENHTSDAAPLKTSQKQVYHRNPRWR